MFLYILYIDTEFEARAMQIVQRISGEKVIINNILCSHSNCLLCWSADCYIFGWILLLFGCLYRTCWVCI